jgi:shikimate kinase
MTQHQSNIILIGMAGCGKSTVGRMLAGMLHMSFVDTDELIVQARQQPLQDIIDAEGAMGFRRIEEEILLALNVNNHVVATGGSTIYSGPGMAHLAKIGLIILLQVRLEVLKKRVGDTSGRGLVKQPGQSFEELFGERGSLYARFAEITIECSDMDPEEVCETVIGRLTGSRIGGGSCKNGPAARSGAEKPQRP